MTTAGDSSGYPSLEAAVRKCREVSTRETFRSKGPGSDLSILQLASELAFVRKHATEGIDAFNEGLFLFLAKEDPSGNGLANPSVELEMLLFSLQTFNAQMIQMLSTSSLMTGKLLEKVVQNRNGETTLTGTEKERKSPTAPPAKKTSGLFDVEPVKYPPQTVHMHHHHCTHPHPHAHANTPIVGISGTRLTLDLADMGVLPPTATLGVGVEGTSPLSKQNMSSSCPIPEEGVPRSPSPTPPPPPGSQQQQGAAAGVRKSAKFRRDSQIEQTCEFVKPEREPGTEGSEGNLSFESEVSVIGGNKERVHERPSGQWKAPRKATGFIKPKLNLSQSGMTEISAFSINESRTDLGGRMDSAEEGRHVQVADSVPEGSHKKIAADTPFVPLKIGSANDEAAKNAEKNKHPAVEEEESGKSTEGGEWHLVGGIGCRKTIRRGSSVEYGETQEINDELADPNFREPTRAERRSSLVKGRSPTGYVRLSKEDLSDLEQSFADSADLHEDPTGGAPLPSTGPAKEPPVQQETTDPASRPRRSSLAGANPPMPGKGERRGSVTLSAVRPVEIGDPVTEGEGETPTAPVSPVHQGGRKGSVASTDGGNGNDFWDAERAFRRHKKITERKPTGQFDYDEMPLPQLKTLHSEAVDIDDETMQQMLMALIAKKEAAIARGDIPV